MGCSRVCQRTQYQAKRWQILNKGWAQYHNTTGSLYIFSVKCHKSGFKCCIQNTEERLRGPTYMDFETVRRFHVIGQLQNEYMFFTFFQKTKNVFFNSVSCFFGISQSSNWMLQQAIFHHHNFCFSVKKNGVQQMLFATDCYYSHCPKQSILSQCLKMKIIFVCAPRADIRRYCGVLPAYWCDKCSSPLLLISSESVTYSNTV